MMHLRNTTINLLRNTELGAEVFTICRYGAYSEAKKVMSGRTRSFKVPQGHFGSNYIFTVWTFIIPNAFLAAIKLEFRLEFIDLRYRFSRGFSHF